MSTTPGVGIAGSGFGVRVVLPCLRAAGFDVRTVCSRTPARIEAESRAHGVTLVTSDYGAMLADPAIDLVCVATYPALHAEMAIAALEAGKHLLCEKPLAPTAPEAMRIAEAARGRRVVAAVDHELRFHPNFVRTRHSIANGEIGAVRHVELRYASAVRVDPTLPWTWWADASAGGGQLNALGSHMVDALTWWLDDAVVGSQGTLATFAGTRPVSGGGSAAVTADEFASFQLRFSRGAVASVVVSAVDPTDSGLRVEVVGERGRLSLDGFDSLSLATDHAPPRDISVEDDLLGIDAIGLNGWRTSLVRYGQHLIGCIRDDLPFLGATLEDGVETQRVLDAVRSRDGLK